MLIYINVPGVYQMDYGHSCQVVTFSTWRVNFIPNLEIEASIQQINTGLEISIRYLNIVLQLVLNMLPALHYIIVMGHESMKAFADTQSFLLRLPNSNDLKWKVVEMY